MDWLKFISKVPSDFGLIYVLDQVLIFVRQSYELKSLYLHKAKKHFIKTEIYHTIIPNLQSKIKIFHLIKKSVYSQEYEGLHHPLGGFY